MKKRFRAAGLAAAAVLTGTLLFLNSRPPEPVEGGRRLSEWLGDFSFLQPHDTENPERQAQEAAQVIRRIGTNALPTLLTMLRARDSALKQQTMQWVEKQAGVNLRFVPAEDLRHRAVQAFGALGAAAAPAVPALSALLSDPEVGRDAAVALARIGGPGTLALRTSLTNRSPQALHAIVALRHYAPDLGILLPDLLRAMQHESGAVRLLATQAVAEVRAGEKRGERGAHLDTATQ